LLSFLIPRLAPHVTDVKDPQLIATNTVIDAIRIAASTYPTELGRTIDYSPDAWKLDEDFDGVLYARFTERAAPGLCSSM
jgi:hypothetical protein